MVLSEKKLSGTSLYMEDILELLEVPEVPHGDPDVWGHLHLTRFCLRFPKMYKNCDVKQKIIVRNLPILGGHPLSS